MGGGGDGDRFEGRVSGVAAAVRHRRDRVHDFHAGRDLADDLVGDLVTALRVLEIDGGTESSTLEMPIPDF